jgi:apolipoprotein N-acyltransferase
MLFLATADYDIWPLAYGGLVPLLVVALDRRTDRPLLWGWWLGLVANWGGFSWIVGFLMRFGHLPLIAALPIHVLLVGYQALTFALFAWLTRRLHDATGLGVTWLAPTVYVAVELVVPYVFPFYLAITQAWQLPVIQLAELTGPLGVSFLIVLVNAALYELVAAVRRGQLADRALRLRVGSAALATALCLGFGVARIHQIDARRAAAPKLKVGVVQANIGIHEKFRPQLALHQLSVHQELSRELTSQGAELIVWPESSYPFTFGRTQAADWYEGDARRVQRGFSTPTLFGALTADLSGRSGKGPYNSALLLDGQSQVRGLFDKNILMVFGEYVPWFEHMRWLKELIPEVSNMERGSEVAVFPLDVPRLGRSVSVGPMICYEDIFPSFGRRLVGKGPNLLVNLTNDAWFGRTAEPWEHLALAVYRSVETRLDLVRAVNTGVSAFIDSTGRLNERSPSVDPDATPHPRPVALLGEVAVQEAQTLYATLGEWFGGLCLAIVVVLGLIGSARAGRPVRWGAVARAAVLFSTVLVVGVALLSGPSSVGLGLRLWSLRPLLPEEDPVAFGVGVRLALSGLLGALLAGVEAGRRGPERLELAIGVLAAIGLPAVALGSLEGAQAGLVLACLFAVGLASLGARLTGRRSALASGPSAPTR